MVGEEKPVRNRRLNSSTYETLEKDENQRRPEEGQVTQTPNNGRLDIQQLIRKKIQLTAEAEQLKPVFMKEVDNYFDEFVTSLIEKSTSLDSCNPSSTSFSTLSERKDHHRVKELRAPPEHGKIFVSRRSLLDELFEVDHIRTIYHMFIAILILFILSTLVVDYIDEGRLVLEFNLLSYAFGKFPTVIWAWWAMFLSTLTVPYVLFQQWARGYPKSSYPVIYSLFYGLLFMLFQIIGLGCGPTYVVLAYSLPPASRFIIILEQVRFVMKAHSFVRENVPRVLASIKEKSNVPIPQLNQYLYFLFAPTLIYRDSYPRTATIRWSYVATKFAQVFGCLFYVYYIFERLCAPLFRNIKQEPFSMRVLVLCVFNSILPGVLIFFLAFFAFLHCWLNAFAEMLRFGDRMFYKDWWNSTSYANYYRTWNVVVHDWLYYYAYQDFLWFFSKRFKAAAMLSVFAVSAVVHEYALALSLNFFYPVLFVLFMFFGMAFNFLVNDHRKRPIWNVMMWTSIFLGQGVILCFYSQEWYARQHCPLKNPTFLDYIRPRSWTCRYQF
ncbi:sterol O-acyltransferase 1 isoform X1 [Tachyglossus aculeatus]|uniref:sterol O-acyltransferase 1 isoform X1 n=2 Tax=Tachyglossus aculeatus TaxID=9261 RepID=UPI0018F6BC3C|nr:sterol O-acyltransferase 1 isoform X1 [Tachyglossus aculeatus]